MTSAAASDIDELGIGGDEWIRQQRLRDRQLLAGYADIDDDVDERTRSRTTIQSNDTRGGSPLPAQPLSITTSTSTSYPRGASFSPTT